MNSPAPAVVLVSCYELGRQPLAVATAARALHDAGIATAAVDLACQRLEDLDAATWTDARLVAVSVPMHTALRLAARAIPRIRALAPRARLVLFGMYAGLNATHLRSVHDVDAVTGGECEPALVELARAAIAGRPAEAPAIVLGRGAPPTPRRDGLPGLDRYARLEFGGETRTIAAVETTRGCLHGCRHCPIPPVYGRRLFVVPVAAVLEDVRRVVSAGARHLTFADPDFLNGPAHALRVARAIRREFPEMTFDATIKIEHLLRHRAILRELAALGCLFVVSAVESLHDDVLEVLDKGHTAADVFEADQLLADAGIALRPSLMPFSPWETLPSYGRILDWIENGDRLDRIDPVQLSIRLLVPPGSWLESHPRMTPHLRGSDAQAFQIRWEHPDPAMDRLHVAVAAVVAEGARREEDPRQTLARIRAAWCAASGRPAVAVSTVPPARLQRRPPRITEPWFC